MKSLTTEQRYLLKAFDADPKRRAVLKSLFVMGVGAAAAGKFANVLAASSADTVDKLVILSQPGVLPELCTTISTPAINADYDSLEVEIVDSNNATSYPRMLAQRNSPVISGAMINDYFAQRGITDGMWEKFDPDIMTNLEFVPEELLTPGGYGIPFIFSPFGIMYNPDKVEAPTSWKDLWKPEYKNRVSMWDAYFDAYVMAGMVSEGKPEVDAGIDAWKPHKKNIGAWVSSPIVESDLVSRGEVWLAPHWGAYCELARSQDKNVAFAMPEEGAVQWACHMQLCKGFDEAEAHLAQLYMNTWLSEEFQLAAAEKGFFSPVNRAVTLPEALQHPGIMTVDEAIDDLIRPDFKEIGSQIPKYKRMIDRSLKG